MINEKSEVNFHVDLIRTVAIFLVILLHSAVEPHPIVTQMDQAEVIRWWTVTVYTTISEPCVPLFVLVSGALLLQPSKIEPLGVFFKKRLNRIGLPFVFWGIVYFAWRQFVNGDNLDFGSILHGIETGPYYHFWFLYMILGLYLLTPFIRIIMAHTERNILRYGLILWFIGTAIVPLLGIFDSNILSVRFFLVVGWPGYFVLGAYLLKSRIKPIFLYLSLFIGSLWTMVGTYYMTLLVGGTDSLFFFNTLSANMIILSVAMFMLLKKVSHAQIHNRFPRFDWLIHKIGQNTLPIYLFHVIVLETFQKGLLGFTISVNTLTPAYEIPLLAIIALFVCLGIIMLLKKIPYLRRLIG